jgi:hypothetical protein
MKERFITRRFKPSTLEIIERAVEICEDYRAQGYSLTLRQLYYRFVSTMPDFENTSRSYKNLGSAINDARLAGLMDWSHIEDRTRSVGGGYYPATTPGDSIARYASYYTEPLWKGQDYRPEVWVEKEALADVVRQAAGGYRVPTFACRGYVSQTAMYDAAKRFERRRDQGLMPVVIHLGDHDPSGIDMTRDIRDRLEQMSWGDVEVRRIALNMDQIRQYDPPPDPAKVTDSRALGYIATYGDSSWELDALEPRVLTALIESEIESVLDRDLFDSQVLLEEERRAQIVEIAERYDDLRANWDDILGVIS